MSDRLAGGKRTADRSDDPAEDYNPFENRPPGPLTSDFAALVHLLKSATGNGVLFLPNAFKRTGYVMSVICGLCVGLLCTHTITLLVRAAQELCVRHRVPMLDFAKAAELSVQGGPERFRKYGRMFGIFTNVLICFVHFQACVIYTLYVSTSFQQVIEFFSGVELNIRLYILLLYPILCFLGYTPSLKYLAPFSVIGFIFISLGIFVSLYYLLQDIPDPSRLSAFTHVLPIPMYCNMFLYALHNATLCLPLENVMENPKHLPRIIIISTLFNTCMYILFGFLGYNKYMDDTCDTVIKNLPLEEALANSVKITVSLSALLSFGLVVYVPIVILWPLIEARVPQKVWGLNAFRLSAVTLTTLVAIAVPTMIPLLGLLASVSMTSIMLMIPAVIDTTLKWERATAFLYAKNAIILVIYVILSIFGALEGILSIIREYSDTKQMGC